MGSSPGFGSTSRDSLRPVRTRFRCGCGGDRLNLATKRNSPVHSSIGTPSAFRRRPPTARKHTVSGTVSLPFRGTFHLSLTVLVRYRSLRVFSLGKWAPQFPTRFHRAAWYSGTPSNSCVGCRLPGSHRLWRPVPGAFAYPRSFSLSPRRTRRGSGALQHRASIGWYPVRLARFGLLRVRSPLLPELFLFLGVLRCFSSPAYLHRTYVFGPG